MKHFETHHVCGACAVKLTDADLAGAVETDGLRFLQDPLHGEQCEKCGKVPPTGTLSYAFERDEPA